GNEVTPDALDAPRLGNVARETDRAHNLGLAPQRVRAQLENLARRPVELQLSLGAATRERFLQQLAERVFCEHLTSTRAGEAPRGTELRTTSRPMRSIPTTASVDSSSAARSQCCTASACNTRSSASRRSSTIASVSEVSSPASASRFASESSRRILLSRRAAM